MAVAVDRHAQTNCLTLLSGNKDLVLYVEDNIIHLIKANGPAFCNSCNVDQSMKIDLSGSRSARTVFTME